MFEIWGQRQVVVGIGVLVAGGQQGGVFTVFFNRFALVKSAAVGNRAQDEVVMALERNGFRGGGAVLPKRRADGLGQGAVAETFAHKFAHAFVFAVALIDVVAVTAPDGNVAVPAAAFVEDAEIVLHRLFGFRRHPALQNLSETGCCFAGLIVFTVQPCQFQPYADIVGRSLLRRFHLFQRAGNIAPRTRQQPFGHQYQMRFVAGKGAVVHQKFLYFVPLPVVDRVINAQGQIVFRVRHMIGLAADVNAAFI